MIVYNYQMKGVQHNSWFYFFLFSLTGILSSEIFKLNGDFSVSFCVGKRERDGCFQIFHDCVKILG